MVNLNIEYLKNEYKAKEIINKLSLQLADQYLNTNIILNSNRYWINMVHQDKAYNPSTEIIGSKIYFSNNKITKKKIPFSVVKTVEFFKGCDLWDSHKEECEQRFVESQNWIKLLTLVSLYELWECVFRKELINLINLKHKELTVLKKPSLLNPTFGDLRHIRNNYLHSNGCFEDSPEKLEVFSSYFHKGKKMEINEDDFCEIRRQILFALQDFPNNFKLGEKNT